MFSEDQTAGRVVCLADYGRLKAGAIVPVANELYADVEAWLAEGNVLAEFSGYPEIPPQEIEVPERVSRMQAEMQLHRAGLLGQVDMIMQDPATDPEIVIAWQAATEVRRNSPTVAQLASRLGLTDAELDDLFIDAVKIEA